MADLGQWMKSQGAHATANDRYPALFRFCADLMGTAGHPKVLSFGCSEGMEVRTLRNYLPHARVDGVDIEPDMICENRRKNNDHMVHYLGPEEMAGKTYDLVFALSVLCYWPERETPYPLELFEATLAIIDGFVRPRGFLALYNTTYFFEDSPLAAHYEKCSTAEIERYDLCTRWWGRGRVHKYHAGDMTRHTPAIPYGGVVFRKL